MINLLNPLYFGLKQLKIYKRDEHKRYNNFESMLIFNCANLPNSEARNSKIQLKLNGS